MFTNIQKRSFARRLRRTWFFGLPGGAFLLRVYALGGQSLWNDEGTSVALASRSLEAIADGAAKDIHPPLYYFLLHFWMPLAGDSEYSVRFLSVVAGVLLVAFTTRLALDLFGSEAALVAGLLSALAPFQVYYSQETRMYIWVALWCAASVWAMATWRSGFGLGLQSKIKNQKSKIHNLQSPICLYVGATIAALYTHYFAPAVILAENFAFAGWLALQWRWVREPSSTAGPRSAVKGAAAAWVAAQLLIGLAFLPWYLYAGNQLAAWPSISEPFDLPTLLWRVLGVFSTGLSLDGAAATIAALILGALLLVGVLPTRDGRANWNVGLLGLWLLLPIGVMYVVSLSRPAYNPKFLLLATPPFFILVARGLSVLAERIPGVLRSAGRLPKKTAGLVRSERISALFDAKTTTRRAEALTASFFGLPLVYSLLGVGVLAVVSLLPSLGNYYTDPRYARDNYRAILQYVDMHAQPGDGLLIDAPGQSDIVRYYLQGDLRLFPLPNGRPPDPARTRADVDEMLAQVNRLFAIYWATEQADPGRIIETRLADLAFKARDEWHGNVRFAVYGIPPVARPPARAINAAFGGEILLAGYRLDAEQLRAGGVETLTLYWTAKQTPAARYKVFVHLLDDENQVVAQRDGEPVGDLRLTTTWRAEETIADNYGIFVEPGTPPGEYRLEIGMYRADNGARLPIGTNDGQAMGDSLILDHVKVLR